MLVVRRPEHAVRRGGDRLEPRPDPERHWPHDGLPAWSENVIDALRAFRDEHRSNGPEPIP